MSFTLTKNIGTVPVTSTMANPVYVSGNVAVDYSAVVDEANSFSGTLGANAVFSGTGVDTLNFQGISWSLNTDVPSAAGGIHMQFSQDNTNWKTVVSSEMPLNDIEDQLDGNIKCHSRYFRLIYVNGASPATAISFKTILYRWAPGADTVGAEYAIHPEMDALVVKSILVGLDDDGSGAYRDITVDAAGHIGVHGERTPADSYANPTQAINAYSLGAVWHAGTSTWNRVHQGDNDADNEGITSTGLLAAETYPKVFNGAGFDRMRGDTTGLHVSVKQSVPLTASISNLPVTQSVWVSNAQGSDVNITASIPLNVTSTLAEPLWITGSVSTSVNLTASVSASVNTIVTVNEGNRASTGTFSTVAYNATQAVIIPLNNFRVGFSIYNSGTTDLFISPSSSVSENLFSYRITPKAMFDAPPPMFVGNIYGVWSAGGSGRALITEYSGPSTMPITGTNAVIQVSTSPSNPLWVTGTVATGATGGQLVEVTASVPIAINNFPVTQSVFVANQISSFTGDVAITSSVPLTATIPGGVSVTNLPVTQSVWVANAQGSDVNITASITLPVTMSTTQATPVWVTGAFSMTSGGGDVNITASVPISINNFPVTQSVWVSNAQGSDVNITASIPLTASVSNFPTGFNVNITGSQILTVGVNNLPTVQQVTSTLAAPLWITGTVQSTAPAVQTVTSTLANPLYAVVTASIPGLVQTLQGVNDTANSTTSNLLAGGVFTGVGFDIYNYTGVIVSVFANQSSAANGLSLQWSQDNVNWDEVFAQTYTASTPLNLNVPHRGRYFRVVYTNGAVGQTTFRLTVQQKGGAGFGDIDEVVGTIVPQSHAQTVKSITVVSGVGGFVNALAIGGITQVTSTVGSPIWITGSVSTGASAVQTVTSTLANPVFVTGNLSTSTTTISGALTATFTGSIPVANLSTNPLYVYVAPVASATVTSQAASITNVTLKSANSARKGMVITNEATGILYVKFGATASSTSYTYRLPPGALLEFATPVYTGVVDGIWSTTGGSAYITEILT